MKIAIVGGGVTGITLAWLLSEQHEVVIYEKQAQLGGDYGSIELQELQHGMPETEQEKLPKTKLERGNTLFFPDYHKQVAMLFEYLDIYTEPCPLTYYHHGDIRFTLTSIPNQSIACRQPLAILANYRIKRDLNHFEREIKKLYRQQNLPVNLTLRQYLQGLQITNRATTEVLHTMAGMLWNYSAKQASSLLARDFIEFLQQSSLLGLPAAEQGRYIPAGLDGYLDKLLFKSAGTCHLNTTINGINLKGNGVQLLENAKRQQNYDAVIITLAAANALEIIDPAYDLWHELLNQIKYNEMTLYIHHDSQLPPLCAKQALSCVLHGGFNHRSYSYHYNLSKLYKLPGKTQLMMSLNLGEPPPELIYQSRLRRPDLGALGQRVYRKIGELQGSGGIFYCSESFAYGTSSLTGGIAAAFELAEQMGVKPKF